MHLDELALPLERLEVVRDRHEVRLGRELVRGMAPVRIGKRTELAPVDQALDPGFDAREVFRARLRPIGDRLRELRRGRRVRVERRHDVDPVECVQMIEVDHVVLDALGRDDQVTQQACIGWRFGADGVLHGANRGDRMNRGAHAADALDEGPSVTRVATLQDDFDPAKHSRRRPGVGHLAAVDFRLYAQMAFDAGYRVDNNMGHSAPPSPASISVRSGGPSGAWSPPVPTSFFPR